MAWNPSPKVAKARDLGELYHQDQVIILLIDNTNDTLEYISWGRTKKLCDDAQELADAAYEAVFAAIEE